MKGKIFTAQEVQGIITGNKMQFREVIKPSRWSSVEGLSRCPTNYLSRVYGDLGAQFQHPLAGTQQSYGKEDEMSPYGWFKCPYQVGQKIFCKEKWGIGMRPDQFGGYTGFEYAADCFGDNEELPCYEIDYEKLPKDIEIDDWYGNWQTAKSMPQWASRITLRIKDISVERLADISEEDAIAEGMFFTDYGKKYYPGGYQNQEAGWNWKENKSPSECLGSAYWAFANFWNATHKKPEEKWGSNPWVWVVDFNIKKGE
jgi:hypothetical protein